LLAAKGGCQPRLLRLTAQARSRAPDGTRRIAVHNTFIAQSIYGTIQEYAAIDRPEWLDL
jgi:hypothetical protein